MTFERQRRWQRTDELAATDHAVQHFCRGSAARLGRNVALTFATFVLAGFLLASCNFLGGSQPKTFDYAGTWRGSVTDASNGAGTFAATLDQSGYTLSGTWHSVMADDAGRQDGGALSGQIYTGGDGDLLDVTLSPAASGQCSYKLNLSRKQDAISGEYAPSGGATGCVNLDRGTIQLTRQ